MFIWFVVCVALASSAAQWAIGCFQDGYDLAGRLFVGLFVVFGLFAIHVMNRHVHEN